MRTRIGILILLIVTMASCDSFLAQDPESFLSPDDFYNSEEDALAAVNAVYDLLNENVLYRNALWYPTDMSTDDMAAGTGVNNPDIRAIDSYTHESTNGKLLNVWHGSYETINRANAVIGRVPKIDMDAALKKRIVGEAQFLRALMYFNLVRLFGDVPLLVKETASLENLEVSRTSAAAVYAQIIKDLKAAETILPVSYMGDDVGRATRGAAKTLLAKVYLTLASEQANNVYPDRKYAEGAQAYFQLAAEKAREVIDAGTYALWEDYADAFSIENENGKESIFAVQFQSDTRGEGSTTLIFTLPRNTSLGRGYGSNVPTDDLYESYQENDLRKDVNFFTSYTLDGETVTFDRVYFFKYFDENSLGTGDADNNWPVFRYAEVLLIYAEALNEVNGPTPAAYQALNAVRTRAGLAPLSGLSQAAFREAVYQERRWEFAHEGKRWFDLVRTGRLVRLMRAKGYENVQDFHTRWPIPQREIEANPNLTQNPGY